MSTYCFLEVSKSRYSLPALTRAYVCVVSILIRVRINCSLVVYFSGLLHSKTTVHRSRVQSPMLGLSQPSSLREHQAPQVVPCVLSEARLEHCQSQNYEVVALELQHLRIGRPLLSTGSRDILTAGCPVILDVVAAPRATLSTASSLTAGCPYEHESCCARRRVEMLVKSIFQMPNLLSNVTLVLLQLFLQEFYVLLCSSFQI